MKFATFSVGGSVTWGVIEGQMALDCGDQFPDLKACIAAGALHDVTGHAARHKLSDITWLPVIPNPEKILCVGLNYEMHRQETGRAVVAHPTIFARFANSQTGHLASLVRPHVSTELDFEGELAIVIGRPGRNIEPDAAFSHIAGYACYNDGSVRDWQAHSHQFIPGKNFPGTGAFGPWMVTPNEIADLGSLRLQTRVNGAVVQEARLQQMIFNIPAIVAYCSAFTRLEPGDVIATGTPGGVGAKRKPPLWLAPGDVVEVEIDEIGLLRNTVADEDLG
jgi:2-keto-4-pentenoate hydratase/2-oxohepta-3-ene-1,7-dioic acid hydratase in catechol pathway